jgi:hypothetical protein
MLEAVLIRIVRISSHGFTIEYASVDVVKVLEENIGEGR